MSASNDDILEHLIPFHKTVFKGSAAEEYACRTIECLEELIALRAELEKAREALRWRDAETEKPDHRRVVIGLSIYGTGTMGECFYDEERDTWYWNNVSYPSQTTIVSWMPMPRPPEAE